MTDTPHLVQPKTAANLRRDASAILGLADAELAQGQWHEAIKLVSDLNRSTPLDDVQLRKFWLELVSQGQYELAISFFDSMPKKQASVEDVQYNKAYCLHQVQRSDEAGKILKDLIETKPDSVNYLNLCAHVLLALSRPGEAVALFERLRKLEPENWHHVAGLSSTLLTMGRAKTALTEYENYIAGNGPNDNILLQAVHAAKLSGLYGKAEELLRQAQKISPANPQVHESLADLYLTMNRLVDAKASINRALELSPSMASYRNLRILISEREVAQSGMPSVQKVKVQLRSLPKRLSRGRTFEKSIASQVLASFNIIWNIALRDIRTREAKSKIGIAMAIVEPLAHILALWAVMNVMLHGRPPLGEHWFFFYATGVLPFLLVTHLGGHGAHGHEPHQNLLEVPVIKPMLVLAGIAFAELIVSAVVALLVFGAFYLTGVFHGANNFYSVFFAYITLWMLGVSLLFLNTGLSSFAPLWGKAWYTIQRILYFTSGIFYMAQMTPPYFRDFMVWNPLLVGIEWFRNGFFEQYQPPWLDVQYLLFVITIFLTLGVALEYRAGRKARH